MGSSLRSFIKSVRKAKTIADERKVIQKESAAIRSSFRDIGIDQTTRRVSISKLIYLYILGEKTHFGQVECLKLLSSQRFADKRLGYLACMLILDENQEVLTLLTNSLDNDMQHPNSFIVGLALCCLGNIASPELSRDLYQNVETIIQSKNVYLKKKACIVAAKLIEKDSELVEFFINKIPDLISEKNPAVLLGCLRLINSCYNHTTNQEDRQLLIKTIPKIVNHLKRISPSGYQPDYDVMGTTDPFLQVQLLESLRILSSENTQYIEEINDVLTQVASNLDSGKNPAHAVLYECVKTIFSIQSDQSLKILGVNILGKFLSIKDNNTRYVALDTLLTVVNIEPSAVQRHRSTIVSCLTDGDISIKRRALELSFGILNDQNIRVLAREILTFLENCNDSELKTYTTSQLTIAINKYSPNEKWHFDTIIRMLKVSGNSITSDIVSNILALILQCNDEELKKHVTLKLYNSCSENPTQFSLALITVWTIGEYADLILGEVAEIDIYNLIMKLSNLLIFSKTETIQLMSYILTCSIKLSIRFKNSEVVEKLRIFINSKTHDSNLEIQIRAVEYQEIFNQKDANLKRGLFAKMPPPPVKERENIALNSKSQLKPLKQLNGQSEDSPSLLELFEDTQTTKSSKTTNEELLDLFDIGTSATSNTEEEIIAFDNSNLKIVFIPKSFISGFATIETIISSNTKGNISQFQLLIAVPKSQKLTISSTSGGDTIIGNSNDKIKQILKIQGNEGSKIKLRIKVKYLLDDLLIEDQFDFNSFKESL
ncbi:unnamed protein product [Candida verbasci]|uniref:AP-1 complex subunit gamma n=1 Tax=Candida verbasci TaxID=1227364 RepID=A0A9W4TRM1_9ASCO|nr:unnamed protein product [Candida verbasci]